MESQEIYNMLVSNDITNRFFGGIYPSDKIPSIKKDELIHKLFFIFNTDPSYEEGSHWITIGLNPYGDNIYFDSYGFPPLHECFKDFMEDDYVYNTKQVQHHFSTTCGQWCIFFILHQITNGDITVFYKRFDSDRLLKNDHEINNIINAIFKTNNKVIDRPFLIKQIAKQFSPPA